MNISHSRLTRGWLCVAAVLWALPVAAQRTPLPAFRTFLADDGWALLVIVVCGMLGAFVADIVTDGGRVDAARRDDQGWALGFVGKLIVGAVAALVTLGLNPAEGWWQLIAAALTAGVGAEAILLAIVAGKKARDAENAREQAEEASRAFGQTVLRHLDGLDSTIETMGGGGESALDGVKGIDVLGKNVAPSTPNLATLRAQTTTLRAEVAAHREGPSVRDRVRDCISATMPGHDMSEPIRGDAGLRSQIDTCIGNTFPNVRPPWVTGTTKATDTLATLTRTLVRRGAS